MNRKIALTSLLLACLFMAGSALADLVTFDYEPLGTLYGSPVGNVPGDYIFSEYGADLYVTDFISGGAPFFNVARIDPAMAGPSIWFGSGQILSVNNIDIIFQFSSAGDVVFDYLDLGGNVNLQVNGAGAVLVAPDLPSLTGLVAPGVTLNVTTTPVPGGHMGHATLTGPVSTLRLGGQEFYLEDVTCNNGYLPGTGPCDFLVDHESLGAGMNWGSATNIPGDLIFTEDGIPVLIDVITYTLGGTGFNYCQVTPTPDPGFGYNLVMNLNNVANIYDIAALATPVSQVTFEFLDYGGEENLQVNGAALQVGEMSAMPAAIAPGVTFAVTTASVPGGIRGKVTLTGDVQKLLVAGQEFYIDNICVTKGGGGGGTNCNIVSDNESQPFGMAWGGAYGSVPGTFIFNENGIEVGLEQFDDGYGIQFQEARIDNAFCPIGSGQAMMLNNICAMYDFSAFSPVQEVSFDYCDGAGIENLWIDGNLYVGDIEVLPAGFFPGVTASVTVNSGPGYQYGTVTLVGDIQRMWVGGQQFAIDDVCVIPLGLSPVPVVGNRKATLDEVFPNPFNPRTTLSFSLAREGSVRLSIVDLRGRRVATLVDGTRTAGAHQVVWDGADDHGAQVPSGVYFVMLEVGDVVQTRKISLLK